MQRQTETDFQDAELLLPRVFLFGVEEQHASVEQQDWMSSLKDEASNSRILGQRLGLYNDRFPH